MGTITSKSDRSLGFRLNTPELTDEEKVEFMRLQNEVLECFIKPLDMENAPELKISTEKGDKSLTQRLANVLYALYMRRKEAGDFVPEYFEDYRRDVMEKLINTYKEKLEEYE
jgi:hypothetical protein